MRFIYEEAKRKNREKVSTYRQFKKSSEKQDQKKKEDEKNAAIKFMTNLRSRLDKHIGTVPFVKKTAEMEESF